MKSESEYFELITYTNEIIEPFILKRNGETKLGEKLNYDPQSTNCQYIIIGISEDIGPQANLGNAGSTKAYDSFISRFVNTQSNRFLNGNEICILGEIIQNTSFSNISESRIRVQILDNFISKILKPLFESGKKNHHHRGGA